MTDALVILLDIIAASIAIGFVLSWFANRTRWPELEDHPFTCSGTSLACEVGGGVVFETSCGRSFARAEHLRWHYEAEHQHIRGPLFAQLDAICKNPRLRSVAAISSVGPLDRFTLPPGVAAPTLRLIK